MITLTKTFTYTDTEENLLFWATNLGLDSYKPKLKRLVDEEVSSVTGDTVIHKVIEEYDNPQSVKEFCEEYIVKLITKTLVTPIKKEVARQVELQSKAQAVTLAEQKAQEVIGRLTVE